MARIYAKATTTGTYFDQPALKSMDIAQFTAIGIITACLSSAVRLSLTPIYGQLSNDAVVSVYATTFIFLWLLGQIELKLPKLETCLSFLPLYLSVVPLTLQSLLFRLSFTLGPRFGPSVTDAIISSPLLWMMFKILHRLPQHIHLGRYSEALVGVTAYTAISMSYHCISPYFELAISSFALATRTTLFIYLACLACLVQPSRRSGLVALPIAYTILCSPHLPFRTGDIQLNKLLESEKFSMLERAESKTGYISVLENHNDGFRALRCDHSLLGGNWLLPVAGNIASVGSAEPIFGVFAMLEAVRLMTHTHEDQLGDEKDLTALVIGLGIGTCPSALSTHGIHTTVVELDPAIIHFATKYFGLLENVTVVNEDAVAFSENMKTGNYTYDYIVHDVFTGGAEPAALFTVQFLQSLYERLDYKGYIAINYAGDLNQTPAALVLRTIREVFNQCRVFRDHLPKAGASDGDFANMVIFCTKQNVPWHFRVPRLLDFLGSSVRREHLLPRHEISRTEWHSRTENVEVIDKNRLWTLEQFRQDGLQKHWFIMRKVLPSKVWELW